MKLNSEVRKGKRSRAGTLNKSLRQPKIEKKMGLERYTGVCAHSKETDRCVLC